MSHAKVIAASLDTSQWDDKDEIYAIYKNGEYTNISIEIIDTSTFSKPMFLKCTYFDLKPEIELGKLEIQRTVGIEIEKQPYDITIEQLEDKILGDGKKRETHVGHYRFEPEDYIPVVRKHIEDINNKFYLTEKELLDQANEILGKEHDISNFRRQVEIKGCIVDGLAFLERKDYNPNASGYRIIGFEAKSNRDNYSRLPNQMMAYLAICDEVYLVIEDKKLPDDLPFNIGVIRVKEGKTEIERRPQTLFHTQDIGEIWKTLMDDICKKSKLRVMGLTKKGRIAKRDDLVNFFRVVENIKRKLIWNQFAIGYTNRKDYVQLNDEEKRIFKLFFSVGPMQLGIF